MVHVVIIVLPNKFILSPSLCLKIHNIYLLFFLPSNLETTVWLEAYCLGRVAVFWWGHFTCAQGRTGLFLPLFDLGGRERKLHIQKKKKQKKTLTLGFVYWLFDLITVWRGQNWLLIDLIIQFVCFRHDSSWTAAALERSDECSRYRRNHRQQSQQFGSDHDMCLFLCPFQILLNNEPTCLYQWTALSPHPQKGKVGTAPEMCPQKSLMWRRGGCASSYLQDP